MTNFPKWSDVRAGLIAEAGGEQGIAEAHRRNQAYIDGHRLAERCKTLGLSQTEVAEKMGVTKSRFTLPEARMLAGIPRGRGQRLTGSLRARRHRSIP